MYIAHLSVIIPGMLQRTFKYTDKFKMGYGGKLCANIYFAIM